MIQTELYVDGVEEPAEIFTKIFGFEEIENKLGWRNVQQKGLYQIMLYDPNENEEYKANWKFPEPGQAGQGVQVVIGVKDAAGKRDQLIKRGYSCTELAKAPWGTLEFLFNLREGYVIRVKERA